MYQQKHIHGNARTRERSKDLSGLNFPISEHYERLKEILPKQLRYRDADGVESQIQTAKLKLEDIPPSKYLVSDDYLAVAFPIGDLTANLLRPHFDDTFKGQGLGDRDQRLFYLEDEPLEIVPYTLLVCYEDTSGDRFAIYHDVTINLSGGLSAGGNRVEFPGKLKWWTACPPLLRNGQFDVRRYAWLDYDLGHLFGFATSGRDTLNTRLNRVYANFPRRQSPRESGLVSKAFPTEVQAATWTTWKRAVDKALNDKTLCPPQDYHAALGVAKNGDYTIIHHYGSIESLAGVLKPHAADGVLLDSGGSCAIWGNWLNGNRGGVLANHWNFRPGRGAVAFLIFNGYRGITRAKAIG